MYPLPNNTQIHCIYVSHDKKYIPSNTPCVLLHVGRGYIFCNMRKIHNVKCLWRIAIYLKTMTTVILVILHV